MHRRVPAQATTSTHWTRGQNSKGIALDLVVNLVRVALTDLRGDMRRFGLLIACLALGVGTIAMVGAVGASLQSALNRDARLLLGGDIEARLTYRPATPEERVFFDSLGTVAEAVDFLARARSGDQSVFAAVRAAGEGYPLLGEVEVEGDESLAQMLEPRSGVRGALLDPLLIDRLGIEVGQRIGLGAAEFEVRGVLHSLPDQVSQGVAIGFPMVIATDAIPETEALEPGALARYRYKIVLRDGLDFDTAAKRIAGAFPSAGWEISAPEDATEEFARYFDMFHRFLSIVGLSALLIGGVGVGNAMSAYVASRQRTIATMKALGATRIRVLGHFLIQAMVLTAVGIVIGNLLGAGLTLLVLPYLGPIIGIPLSATVDWPSLGSATVFGALTGFAFAHLPLYRAQSLRPAILFRTLGSPSEERGKWHNVLQPALILPLFLAFAGIVIMALINTGRPQIVFWYAVGVVAAFALLRLAAFVLQRALKLLPLPPDAVLRNAIKSVYRPNSPAPTVVLSLGLGLALLLLIALIDSNLRHQLDPEVRVDSPTFLYMDLFEDEVADFESLAADERRIESFLAVPVVRATSFAVNGVTPPKPDEPVRDVSIYFGDELPLTFSETMPFGSRLVAGEWWPADYSGEPLVSVSDELRHVYGVKLGDQLTFQVFGESVDARIASFRDYEWQRGGINFPFVFSPGALDAFPVAYFGLVKAVEGTEVELQRTLVDAFPELLFIPVDEAIEAVRGLIDSLSYSVGVVGAIALASGALVLAGALATGRHQREADAVVSKVLGATRGEVVRAYIIEYGLVGALAAAIATLIGVAGAWAFMTRVLQADFSANPILLVMVVVVASLLTIAVGAATTWSALSVKPARFLREE